MTILANFKKIWNWKSPAQFGFSLAINLRPNPALILSKACSYFGIAGKVRRSAKMEGGSEEDAREAAMAAAAASLRPNFKPKGGLTEAQLAKFQVLVQFQATWIPSTRGFGLKFFWGCGVIFTNFNLQYPFHVLIIRLVGWILCINVVKLGTAIYFCVNISWFSISLIFVLYSGIWLIIYWLSIKSEFYILVLVFKRL